MSVENVLKKVLETRPNVHVNINKLIEQERREKIDKAIFILAGITMAILFILAIIQTIKW